MTAEDIKKGVADICKISHEILGYNDNSQLLVDAINDVGKEDLNKCLTFYQDRNGVIIDLRKEVIHYLFDGKKLSLDQLEEIVEKHKSGKESQFRGYKKLFNIFYPILTFYGHEGIRNFTESFIQRLINDLGIHDEVKSIYFDFQGPRQQGSDRFWIAVYNKSQLNQSSGLQFFIEFFGGKINYGVYKHANKSYLTPKQSLFPEEFSYEKLLAYFRPEIGSLMADIALSDQEKAPDYEKAEGDLDSEPNNGKYPLNQILYGPPGTGKTYNTINEALKIINDDEAENLKLLDRAAVKSLFDKKVKSGQIVFTTFHQSMSYEDFIEGIKPDIEEDDDGKRSVVYDVKDGIFKRLCKQAVSEYYRFKEKRSENTPLDRLAVFEDAWNNLVELTQSHIDTNKPLHLETLTEKKLSVVSITNQGNLIIKPQVKDAQEYTVSFNRTKKLFDAFPDLKSVRNIDKEFRSVIGGSNSTAYWSVINHLNQWVDKYGHGAKHEERIAVDEKLITFDQDLVRQHIKKKVTPYVLIIDEINRGNVSQIFGELITLIEESKRLGRDEALAVTLPYSKDTFGVPPNLYIIGTMNTADRSVEALDAALRRRFSFTEMLPKPHLIASDGALKETNGELGELDLVKLLQTINRRIEKLVDRDHQIGHSYFLPVDGLEKLRRVFYECLIPLLQEYFFGDYGKIKLVLGGGFVQEKHADAEAGFFAEMLADYGDLVERKIYEIRLYSKDQLEDFRAAIQDINIS